ncbi:hypothetical protein HZH66_000048 [Vespula vulgaris]|uniref:Uncharacterized protein n=1 Tax=Vespula vulgaris TaxID=7454 RepID=A0A834NIY8_VESVU|nr:hypothetical protein HZH66_000048 [Vespula vulgaris]
MHFVKINRIRELLVPHYGKSFVEKSKYLLKLGWNTNPVMTACVASLPLVMLYTLWVYNFHDSNPKVRKYRKHITIYRSDDPRVEKIRHYSIIDN